VKFERPHRYRYRYRYQKKKARRGRACDPVLRDPPTPRTSPRSLFAARDSPPLPPALVHWDEGWPLMCTICFKINIIKSLFTLTHNYIEYTVQ
jgi:hypothetical protein